MIWESQGIEAEIPPYSICERRRNQNHPPDDPLHLPREPVDDARLQGLDGVLADHPGRPGQLHLQQLGGPARQRVD